MAEGFRPVQTVGDDLVEPTPQPQKKDSKSPGGSTGFRLVPVTDTFTDATGQQFTAPVQDERPVNPDNLLTKPVETLVRSGGQLVGDVAQAVSDPPTTLKALSNVAVGGVKKLGQAAPFLGPLGPLIQKIPGDQEQFAEAIGGFYTERYGNLERAKRTALEDPVGFAADVATLFTGAGVVVKGAGVATKSAAISRAGAGLSAAGVSLDPLVATTRGIGAAGKAVTGFGKQGRFAPLAKSLDVEAVNAAKVAGVDLPATALSKSGAVGATEGFAAKGFGGQKILDRVEKANQQLIDFSEHVVQQAGRAEDLDVAGIRISQGYDKTRQAWFALKDDLYSKVDLRGVRVAPRRSAAFTGEIAQQKRAAQSVIGKGVKDERFFSQLEKSLSSAEVDGPAMKSAIRELNERIKGGKFTDPIVTGNKAKLEKIAVLMSQEFDDALRVQRPEMAQALDTANSAYQAGVDTFQSWYADKIHEFTEAKQYSKIVPALFSKSTAIEDVPRIFALVGAENVGDLRATIMDDLFRRSRTDNGIGALTPRGVSGNVKKLGGYEKLAVMLDPEQLVQVRTIDALAQRMGRLGKLTEGSKTAFMGRIGALILGTGINPVLGFKMFLGDFLANKFIASAAGQKLLTSGFDVSGFTGGVRTAQEIGAPVAQAGRLGTQTVENLP
jgi:hypothetical protein